MCAALGVSAAIAVACVVPLLLYISEEPAAPKVRVRVRVRVGLRRPRFYLYLGLIVVRLKVGCYVTTSSVAQARLRDPALIIFRLGVGSQRET